MKKLHWSKTYINSIELSIPYNDGAVQGWGYDCAQYASLDTLKSNMSNDFVDPRLDRTELSITVERGNESFSSTVTLSDIMGDDFVSFVFQEIDGMLYGN